VALRIEAMGYGLHGHDINVEACICSDDIINVEDLGGRLDEALHKYDYKPLWDPLGDDSLIEDLVKSVADVIRGWGYRVYSISAKLPRGRIIKYVSDECWL